MIGILQTTAVLLSFAVVALLEHHKLNTHRDDASFYGSTSVLAINAALFALWMWCSVPLHLSLVDFLFEAVNQHIKPIGEIREWEAIVIAFALSGILSAMIAQCLRGLVQTWHARTAARLSSVYHMLERHLQNHIQNVSPNTPLADQFSHHYLTYLSRDTDLRHTALHTIALMQNEIGMGLYEKRSPYQQHAFQWFISQFTSQCHLLASCAEPGSSMERETHDVLVRALRVLTLYYSIDWRRDLQFLDASPAFTFRDNADLFGIQPLSSPS